MKLRSLWRRRILSASLAAAALFALPAAEALAHAELKSSSPAADATVAKSPDTIMITFSESIEQKFSGLILTGPDGKPVKTGASAVEGKDHEMLSVPVGDPLAAGKYTVSWHNLSSDGHKLKGSFTFTVKP